MIPRISRTVAGLAGSITLAVVTAFGVGAYLYSTFHYESRLESAEATALTQGELVREALEHQMLEKDRRLIRSMVRGFGGRPDVEIVEVVDHEGTVRYSSQPGREGRTLSPDSPTCGSCHASSAPERQRSQVLRTADRTVLRVVLPIRNGEGCQTCHDAEQTINGIVLFDKDVGGLRASINRDLRRMVGGSLVLAILLVGAVVGIVQVLLIRRLRRFERSARMMADGHLDRRVAVGGSDTLSSLGREFNTMADSMSGLLREVGQQRERLETVINSIDDGIVVLDPSRKILAANRAFLEKTGLGREQVLGCTCGGSAGEVCDAADCPTVACLETGEHQVRICRRARAEGGWAWEEVHSSPVRGPDGKISQVVEVWRDISDRRGAEARMAESHRLASLGMLASGFSHEINTPLATVLTCVESILRQIHTDGGLTTEATRIDETASIARDQILRCKGITQHFLRLSRGHSSPGGLVGVEELVAAVLRLVEPTARARGVEIRLEPPVPSVQVRADEADLQHALINLLINAVEACEGRGQVGLRVEVDGEVRIRVTDNGRGIPPDQLDRIFEPFVSLRDGGTGLGLFLALNFVKQWGGDVRVQSTPGKGSVFEVILPLIEEPAPVESIP